MSARSTQCQVVCATEAPQLLYADTLFLAGTVPSAGRHNWRKTVADALENVPVTIFDPVAPSWDDSWTEDISFEPFRRQVEWELEMQDKAGTVIFFFDAAKDGMVSLLELGLCARTGKAMVACAPGYVKRGNVQVVCKRYGVPLFDSLDQLVEAVLQRLPTGLESV